VNGILTVPFALRDGKLDVPRGPGLGIELDEDLVAGLRVA
jgi:L-alanine-DL-glutamate epimerase-like enolase superfamily enzyme